MNKRMNTVNRQPKTILLPTLSRYDFVWTISFQLVPEITSYVTSKDARQRKNTNVEPQSVYLTVYVVRYLENLLRKSPPMPSVRAEINCSKLSHWLGHPSCQSGCPFWHWNPYKHIHTRNSLSMTTNERPMALYQYYTMSQYIRP